MKMIGTCNDNIAVKDYGGKAFWLNWMYRQGIHVPKSIFIPVMQKNEIIDIGENEIFQNDLLQSMSRAFQKEQKLTVRSSALSEDGIYESKAGHYQTFLNIDNNIDDIYSCFYKMASDLDDNDSLGIIIQEMISPIVSGVVFSSNPRNGKKAEVYISMTSGLGDKLMSGIDAGEDIKLIIQEGRVNIPPYSTKIEEKTLLLLIETAKSIEKNLNIPVDIEWCVESGSKELVILQCRPITTIFLEQSEIIPVNQKSLNLPQYLIDSDKVRLRCMAERNEVMISEAYLAVYNCKSECAPDLQVSINKSAYYRGFSAVLISPSNIDGKIQRYFVGKPTKVYSSTKCHRFGVRTVADYNNIESCLRSLYDVAREEQWTCSVIIQEILDAKYTGIMKKSEDGYVLEIARGHFMSKGLYPMSIYATDSSGSLLYKNEVKQEKYIDIVEGCILEYYKPEGEYISFSDEYIKKIVMYFSDIVVKEHMVVEFGILNNDEMSPYLIDCIHENAPMKISFQSVERGVISDGKVKGKLVKVDLDSSDNVLNMHYYDNEDIDIVSEENVIFYAHSPNIQLLSLLKQYNKSNIGFIFQTGSLLCHTAVVLREHHIPAIRGVDEFLLKEGKIYSLDTYSENILEEQNVNPHFNNVN